MRIRDYEHCITLYIIVMGIKRDTAKYVLKDRNEIVYCGISDNLSRREQEHRREGM